MAPSVAEVHILYLSKYKISILRLQAVSAACYCVMAGAVWRTVQQGVSEDMLHSIRSDVVVRSMSGGKLCIGKDVCCYPHFTDSSPTRETALLWS